MTSNKTLIVRAAAGDLRAWASLLKQSAECKARAAALIMIEEDAPPLTTMFACAALENRAPEPLRQQARRFASALEPSSLPEARRMPRDSPLHWSARSPPTCPQLRAGRARVRRA